MPGVIGAPGLITTVMPIRKIQKLIFFVAVFAAVMTLAVLTGGRNPMSKPVPGITIVGYTNLSTKRSGDVIGAKVMLVNNGKATMSFSISPFDGTPYPSVQAETPSGWTNYNMGGMTAYESLLRPGSNYVFFVFLLTNALRWKMGFVVSTASTRERAIFKLIEHKSLAPLFPILGWPLRLLPNTTESLEVETQVFEVEADRGGRGNKRVGGDSGIPRAWQAERA